MIVVRSSRVLAALGAVATLALCLAPAGVAAAAESRIVRPVTDAPVAAPAAPAAPAPVARAGARAIAITPVDNGMRETAPGVYEGIVPYQLPDGMWRVDLDERFQLFSVLRRAADGALVPGCVQGPAGLSQWRARGAACDHAPASSKPAGATATAAPAVRPTRVVTPEGSFPTIAEVK